MNGDVMNVKACVSTSKEQPDADPQQFQVIIQIFYVPGTSRANNLSTTKTSWHQQCRNDLSALKFPLPPTSSLVCSVSQSIVQMAWNVRATDHIVKLFGRAFNPAADTSRETQDKLDSLDIGMRELICSHQVSMLKRWTSPSGEESLTTAGVLRSSKAPTNIYAAVLPQPPPRTGESSKMFTRSGKVSLAHQPPVSSASLSKILSPAQPPSIVDWIKKTADSTRPSNTANAPLHITDTPASSTKRKRTSPFHPDSHPASSLSPTYKRSKAHDEHSSQTSDSLHQRITDLKAQLVQEKQARTTAETHLYRMQQECANSGLNASQIDLLRSLAFAERDVETYKAKSEGLEQELRSMKALIEAEKNHLIQQSEREHKKANDLLSEIDDLRGKNISLEWELKKAGQKRSQGDEVEALRMQIERQQRQIDKYVSLLQSVSPRDGESTQAVEAQGKNPKSEAAGYIQGKVSPLDIHADLEHVLAELAKERAQRVELEGIVEDMRRECRAPFIVPALVDAFAEISRITSKAKVLADPEA
ncbi:hypothetical protein GYMLUDRAFT_64875 [Collybiopsis luxurians FD-317 M1]|uniref:Uncharacterized protein n=1 Tax=Collybiopsis luxurians FD-317 M1 TaxID=944289 RepID=A0A0D0BP51_9AGAR|nr:hypothetical protein GYMLUDRAFT_64875 [Collybiopsis luxurians FD-317 M1]